MNNSCYNQNFYQNNIFGPHRVKTTFDKAVYNCNNKLDEISDWCSKNLQSMSSYPGINIGEMVWCFEDESDAILFALRWV